MMTSDIRELYDRLGRAGRQPLAVSSFTNKCFIVNFRVPAKRLRQFIPRCLEIDEIRNTGMGLISQCVRDFDVTKFGPLSIPRIHTSQMLCRISVRGQSHGGPFRASYPLRSDSSAPLVGFLGGHFSHFRSAASRFTLYDDGNAYELHCTARDKLCNGFLRADLKSLSTETPAATRFADIDEVTEFVLQLDGSCSYDFAKNKLSFQRIQHPKLDVRFCREFDYDFSLLNHLFAAYDLQPDFDSVLFTEKVPEVWGSSRLFSPGEPRIAYPHRAQAPRRGLKGVSAS